MMTSKLNHLFNDSQEYIIASSLDGSSTFTKSQFQSDLNKLTRHLKDCRQQRWLLAYEDPYLFAVGFFALVSLNKTVVLSANRKSSWLNEIEQSFDGVLGDKLTSIDIDKPLVEIGFSQLALLDSSEPRFTTISGSELIIFFTSGSTGKAKEIPKCLSYLMDEVATLEKTFGGRIQNTRTISSVSHFHIYGLLFNILWPLLSRRLWLTEVVEFQEQLVGMADKLNEFVLVSSPAFLSRLDQSMRFSQAKMVFSSGGPLSFESATHAYHVFDELPTEVYGSTETGGIGYRCQAQENQPWELFDKVNLNVESDGTYLQSPHIGLGSLVKLDDKINILSPNRFILAGRSDRVAKIEEKRISLTEIEEYLSGQSFIQECACVVLQNKRTIIGAALVLTSSGVTEINRNGRYQFFQNLKQTMRTRFENVTIPRKWRILEELPINQQSKREYSELKRLFDTAG